MKIKNRNYKVRVGKKSYQFDMMVSSFRPRELVRIKKQKQAIRPIKKCL